MDKLEEELKDCEKEYREGKETKQRHSKSINGDAAAGGVKIKKHGV